MSLLRASQHWQAAGLVIPHEKAVPFALGMIAAFQAAHLWGLQGRGVEVVYAGEWIHVIVTQEVQP